MSLEVLLLELGLGVSANAVYDIIRKYTTKTQKPTISGLRNEIASELNIDGADISAQKIIEFLAKSGDISIKESRIYASKKITMASSKTGSFEMGDNSSSETDKTKIVTKGKAKIKAKGGAKIEQEEDGSITFST